MNVTIYPIHFTHMKVFLSWSGDQSRQVAEFFSEWVQCVIQACRPWISTRDIDRGSVWFSEISDQLKDVSVGIIFLTQENKNKPWILFESGALAKGLTNNRVCTFLIDLQPGDIQDPLAQFNHTLPNKIGVSGLIRTLNAAMPIPLDDKSLTRVINTYWPQLEQELAKISDSFPKPETSSSALVDEKNILNDIFESLKTLNNRVARIEKPRKPMVPQSEILREYEIERNQVLAINGPYKTEADAIDAVKRLKNSESSNDSIIEYMASKGVLRSWTQKTLSLLDQ